MHVVSHQEGISRHRVGCSLRWGWLWPQPAAAQHIYSKATSDDRAAGFACWCTVRRHVEAVLPPRCEGALPSFDATTGACPQPSGDSSCTSWTSDGSPDTASKLWESCSCGSQASSSAEQQGACRKSTGRAGAANSVGALLARGFGQGAGRNRVAGGVGGMYVCFEIRCERWAPI